MGTFGGPTCKHFIPGKWVTARLAMPEKKKTSTLEVSGCPFLQGDLSGYTFLIVMFKGAGTAAMSHFANSLFLYISDGEPF